MDSEDFKNCSKRIWKWYENNSKSGWKWFEKNLKRIAKGFEKVLIRLRKEFSVYSSGIGVNWRRIRRRFNEDSRRILVEFLENFTKFREGVGVDLRKIQWRFERTSEDFDEDQGVELQGISKRLYGDFLGIWRTSKIGRKESVANLKKDSKWTF